MPDTAAYVGLATVVVFFHLLQKITTANLSREETAAFEAPCAVDWAYHRPTET